MKERLYWVDIAKGIGAILVVVGHVIINYQRAGFYIDIRLFDFVRDVIYSFHMPLFLVISGYLLSKSKPKGTKAQQIFQIIINYGIPYVFFSAIWVFSKIILADHVITELSLKDLLWIPVYPVQFMWFLYTLMLIHIFQIPLSTHPQRIIRVIHIFLSIVGYFIQPYIQNHFPQIRFTSSIFNYILKNYCFFLFGLYYAEFITKITEEKRMFEFILSGIILVAGNIFLFSRMVTFERIIQFISALSGSLFILMISVYIKESHLLEYIGRHAMPIYVLQGFSYNAARIILTKFYVNTSSELFPLCVCSLAGITLPLIVYQLSTKFFHLDALFYPGKYLKVQ